jgi:transposase
MKRFIAGEDRQQITLLPGCLDNSITADNPVRLIEVFVDELDLTALAQQVPYRRQRAVPPTTRPLQEGRRRGRQLELQSGRQPR